MANPPSSSEIAIPSMSTEEVMQEDAEDILAYEALLTMEASLKLLMPTLTLKINAQALTRELGLKGGFNTVISILNNTLDTVNSSSIPFENKAQIMVIIKEFIQVTTTLQKEEICLYPNLEGTPLNKTRILSHLLADVQNAMSDAAQIDPILEKKMSCQDIIRSIRAICFKALIPLGVVGGLHVAEMYSWDAYIEPLRAAINKDISLLISVTVAILGNAVLTGASVISSSTSTNLRHALENLLTNRMIFAQIVAQKPEMYSEVQTIILQIKDALATDKIQEILPTISRLSNRITQQGMHTAATQLNSLIGMLQNISHNSLRGLAKNFVSITGAITMGILSILNANPVIASALIGVTAFITHYITQSLNDEGCPTSGRISVNPRIFDFASESTHDVMILQAITENIWHRALVASSDWKNQIHTIATEFRRLFDTSSPLQGDMPYLKFFIDSLNTLHEQYGYGKQDLLQVAEHIFGLIEANPLSGKLLAQWQFVRTDIVKRIANIEENA